jgi:hypothetical protein
MARIDRREGRETSIGKASLLDARLARVRVEVHRLSSIAEQLKDMADSQISFTHPDVRSMANRGKGTGLVGIMSKHCPIPGHI